MEEAGVGQINRQNAIKLVRSTEKCEGRSDNRQHEIRIGKIKQKGMKVEQAQRHERRPDGKTECRENWSDK